MYTQVRNFYKIDMVQSGHRFGLDLKSLPGHCRHLLRRDYFKSALFVEHYMLGQIDLAHGPTTDPLIYTIDTTDDGTIHQADEVGRRWIAVRPSKSNAFMCASELTQFVGHIFILPFRSFLIVGIGWFHLDDIFSIHTGALLNAGVLE